MFLSQQKHSPFPHWATLLLYHLNKAAQLACLVILMQENVTKNIECNYKRKTTCITTNLDGNNGNNSMWSTLSTEYLSTALIYYEKWLFLKSRTISSGHAYKNIFLKSSVPVIKYLPLCLEQINFFNSRTSCSSRQFAPKSSL